MKEICEPRRQIGAGFLESYEILSGILSAYQYI